MNVREALVLGLFACACSRGTHWGDGAAAPDEYEEQTPSEDDSAWMDGFELEPDALAEALDKVGRDARVTLSCSEAKLDYRLLDVIDDAGADMPRKFAVTGCGKQAIYCCGAPGEWRAHSVVRLAGEPDDQEWWCFAGEAAGKPVGACSPTLDRCSRLAEHVAKQGVTGGTACGRSANVVCFHATRAGEAAEEVFRCFPSVPTCERERANHVPEKGWAVASACGDRSGHPVVAAEVATTDPCAAGDAAACMKAANDLRAKGDDKGAAVQLSRACSAGEAVACLDVGRALEEGRAMERDAARAADFYDKGCQLGANAACDAAARIRAAPPPNPKSKAKRGAR